jgi:uncharacterized protein (DUF1778 family)
MKIDLRTPVTEEQKAIVKQAAKAAGLGVASWCRATLLRAAKQELEKTKKSDS